MKAFGLPAICILLTVVAAVAQEPAPGPFAELERQVKKQQGGWNGDKRVLSAVFDKERRRLGDRFESELLKYIAGAAEKDYWISTFLQVPDYLHGNKPLPYLSLIVMEQGLTLLRGKTDEESLGSTLSFDVLAAVLSQELGFPDLAISHKNEAEQLLSKDPDLYAYFPAMSEGDGKIYEALPSKIKRVRSLLPNDDSADRPKTRISAGVLNGRATKLPLPVYPASAREASGQVMVSVVVDEAGGVIWAKAISGQSLLQKSAEDAAWKAEFLPVKLEGKPEKFSGVLIYEFVKR